MAELINLEAETQPIRITAGDDFPFTVRIKEDGIAQPLAGWTITSQVKNKDTGAVLATLTIGSGVTLQPTVGDALIVIPSTVTENLRTIKCLILDVQTINLVGYKRTYLRMTISGQTDVTQI